MIAHNYITILALFFLAFINNYFYRYLIHIFLFLTSQIFYLLYSPKVFEVELQELLESNKIDMFIAKILTVGNELIDSDEPESIFHILASLVPLTKNISDNLIKICTCVVGSNSLSNSAKRLKM